MRKCVCWIPAEDILKKIKPYSNYSNFDSCVITDATINSFDNSVEISFVVFNDADKDNDGTKYNDGNRDICRIRVFYDK